MQGPPHLTPYAIWTSPRPSAVASSGKALGRPSSSSHHLGERSKRTMLDELFMEALTYVCTRASHAALLRPQPSVIPCNRYQYTA